MTSGMSETKTVKWSRYLLLFISMWAIGVAATFVDKANAAGHAVWGTVLHEAALAAVFTLVFYSFHKEKKE
jgi:hypothetical protein